MKCKGCGAEVNREQLFCWYCGTKNEDGQAPMNQINQNQPQQSQAPMNQINQNQPQQSQASMNQINQGQPPQGQPLMGQPPMNQAQFNQRMHSQFPLGQLPPPVPPHLYNGGKKKSKVPLTIAVIVASLFTIALWILVIISFMEGWKEQQVGSISNSFGEGYTEEDGLSSGMEDPFFDNDNGDYFTEEEIQNDFSYTYNELPNVISIDTDKRFTYHNYSMDEDVATYIFRFADENATEADFYTAVEEYGTLLIYWNDYYYEEDFTQEQYDDTGIFVSYYSKEDTAIGVGASIESDGWYAYIYVYYINGEEQPFEEEDNYSYYIEGRELQYFDIGEPVMMDNGVSFAFHDAVVTELSDGTTQIDCKFDISTKLTDTYLYSDDFLLMPMDQSGNILTDAAMISSISDSNGNILDTPYPIDTLSYGGYTLSFLAPTNTETFTIYATNLSGSDTELPVYCIDLVIE
jgi:hypothetical protein